MTRAILLLLKASALSALIYWLLEQEGHVTVYWQGWRVDASIAVSIITLLFIVLILYWLGLTYKTLRKAPQTFQKNREIIRRERGYKALTQGFVAVAAGDKLEAARQARRASTLLQDPPLTMLLSAQSAQLNGDEDAAKKYFLAMQEDPQASFLGIRGLMTQAVKSGDHTTALSLAEQAFKIRPDTTWVLEELIKLQIEAEKWEDALKTIDQAIRKKTMEREEGDKKKAFILHKLARQARDNGDISLAISQIKKSVRFDPEYSPAVTTYARLLQQTGKLRRGEKVLEDAWRKIPDANIAYTYKSLAPDLSAIAQLKRFERLTKNNQDHEESHFTMARIALEAELWGEARKHISPLIDEKYLQHIDHKTLNEKMETTTKKDFPSARVCRFMAELEEKENKDVDQANYWLTLAANTSN